MPVGRKVFLSVCVCVSSTYTSPSTSSLSGHIDFKPPQPGIHGEAILLLEELCFLPAGPIHSLSLSDTSDPIYARRGVCRRVHAIGTISPLYDPRCEYHWVDLCAFVDLGVSACSKTAVWSPRGRVDGNMAMLRGRPLVFSPSEREEVARGGNFPHGEASKFLCTERSMSSNQGVCLSTLE